MDDIKRIKNKFARENIDFFDLLGINLNGKKVLDVGFGLGYNSKAMRDRGANVYGVEPRDEDYKYAISNGLIDKRKAFNCSLQDIPEDLLGSFDIATVFLYNISIQEREDFSKMLAKAVKADGLVIIGMHDSIYITGDKYIEPVYSSIYKCFDSVYLIKGKNDNIGNLSYIVANDPLFLVKGK